MDIVLASGSPRRKELLETLGLDFAVVPAKGEEIAPRGAGPAETVEALSRAKAEEVAKDFPNALIIAADTVVWADGRILGKPKDETDAKAMLHLLSDNTHEVYTGVTAMYAAEPSSAASARRFSSASCRRTRSIAMFRPESRWTRPALMEFRAEPRSWSGGSRATISMLWGCRCADSAKCSKRSGCIFFERKKLS